MPHDFAPPDGCASTATPAKPIADACEHRPRQPLAPDASRSTTTHSGTDAMISDASPVGTLRSAKNSTAFAPGSRQPMTAHDSSSRRRMRSVPPRDDHDQRHQRVPP